MHFGSISGQQFLNDYWQKKPLLIKQALPDFIIPISAEELAGLSLEQDFESRIVLGAVGEKWQLKNGPFNTKTFANLPKNNWTLLVQGVDKLVNEIYDLVQHFDFIPRWRFDDVMISYATKGGSVGPHFDYYDVFLLQGSGKRRWHISTQHCTLDNYLKNTPLRIMRHFKTEQIFEVSPGDVLYLPPKVAHHGISLGDDCTTLSFGYRAYSATELYEFQHKTPAQNNQYYQDPVWENTHQPACIPKSALVQVNSILPMSADEFGCFVTHLDLLDRQILQHSILDEVFDKKAPYQLHAVCKIAYILDKKLKVFLNGEYFDNSNINNKVMIDFCNQRQVHCANNDPDTNQLIRKLLPLNAVEKITR